MGEQTTSHDGTTQQTLGGLAVDDTPDRRDHWMLNPPRSIEETKLERADIPRSIINDAVEANNSENGTFGEKTQTHEHTQTHDNKKTQFNMDEYTKELDEIVNTVLP